MIESVNGLSFFVLGRVVRVQAGLPSQRIGPGGEERREK